MIKDVFVVNNTRVFPARMYGRKEKTGAKIEVFLLRNSTSQTAFGDVIVDPAKKDSRRQQTLFRRKR